MMKPLYNSLALAIGPHRPGICSILFAPKEWLMNDVTTDFRTGNISSDISLLPGKGWLKLQFIPSSYDYEEKPKSNKSGPYHEINIAGTSNTITSVMLQILNTLKFHQLVCQVKDKRGYIKLVGDKDSGAILQFTHKNKDKQTVDFTLSLDSEYPAPFIGVVRTDTGDEAGVDIIPNGLFDFDNQFILDWDTTVLESF